MIVGHNTEQSVGYVFITKLLRKQSVEEVSHLNTLKKNTLGLSPLVEGKYLYSEKPLGTEERSGRRY